MAADPDDSRSTAPCDVCEMAIPTDADRCPVCGYRPDSYHPLILRLGEAFFVAIFVASFVVLVAGVAHIQIGLPTETVTQLAVITPYTMGVSGFFTYYIHGMRRTKPTDSNVFH